MDLKKQKQFITKKKFKSWSDFLFVWRFLNGFPWTLMIRFLFSCFISNPYPDSDYQWQFCTTESWTSGQEQEKITVKLIFLSFANHFEMIYLTFRQITFVPKKTKKARTILFGFKVFLDNFFWRAVTKCLFFMFTYQMTMHWFVKKIAVLLKTPQLIST